MIKQIDISGALKRIADGSDQVCMLVPIGKDTILSVEELIAVKAFAVLTGEKEDLDPKPEKKKPQPKVDHGKIMALHKRGWPIKEIAKDVGCSEQTVYNHIAQEEKNGTEPDSH